MEMTEKVFLPKQNSGLIIKALTAGFGVGTILFLYGYSQLPWYASQDDQFVLFAGILFCAVCFITGLMNWLGNNKVKLCVGAQNVSGVTVNGITTRQFEYSYDEITDVAYTLGSVTIQVNGKWIAIPGLENGEKAKSMIQQRIGKTQ